jgi:hypothetical protein
MSTTVSPKWFEPLSELILDCLDQIEDSPSMMEYDTLMGKYLLMSQEYLSPIEQKDLNELIGLSTEQQKRFIGNFLLKTMYETVKQSRGA